MLLKDRTAIVTGASRGIGRAIATIFAHHGANLIVCGRGQAVTEVAGTLSATGQRVVAVEGDVADAAFRKQLIRGCREQYGSLDILVNNAGVLSPGLLGMQRGEDMRDMYSVNVEAVIDLTQAAARLMKPDRDPSVINIASIAGTRGMEGVTAYGATKAAVVGFTLCAAKELAARNIRVNAIAPGFIDTDMTRGLSPDWYAKRVASIALKRVGSPNDVAKAALYFASDMSSYVTGQVLGVDGGMLA